MTKTRQWSVVSGLAVLIVFAAGWLLLIKPQRSHASDLKAQAVTQQQANQRLQQQIAVLQSEQKNLPQQQQALQKFSTQVPSDAAEPTLIRQLSDAAAGAGVDLVSMTPGTAAPVTVTATPGSTSLSGSTAPAGLTVLPVTLNVSGSYPNMESFFQSLEKLPRATRITGWTMAPGSSSPTVSATAGGASAAATGELTGSLTANVYYAPSSTPASGASSTAPAPATTTAATS